MVNMSKKLEGKIMQKRIIINLSTLCFISLILAACNGTNNSQNPTPSPTPTPTELFESISIPTVGYAGSKFAVYTSVAGGTPALTEIDTGSDFLLIESSYVGPNIRMTTQTITYVYDHGTNPRTGTLGYAAIGMLANSSSTTPLIKTSDEVPVIVVPDGTVGNQGNKAIMGLRMNGNVSPKLFLPYPYNQMFIADFKNSKLIFGNFENSTTEEYGNITLPPITCESSNVATTAVTPCWNDMAIPVNYVISGNPDGNPLLYNSLFDSGASSSFQFSPLPNWFNVNVNDQLTNNVVATMSTTLGTKQIYLTPTIDAYASDYNGGIVNVGNNIFNYYKILFNQAAGTIGLK